MSLTQTQAAIVLNGLSGIGPVACKRLREFFSDDLAAALSAGEKTLSSVGKIDRSAAEKISHWPRFFDLEKEERALVAFGAKFIPFFSPDFPPLLKQIPDAPIGLYVRGNAESTLARKVGGVAIVGTRKASLYGIANARKISAGLARARQTVISGGARGIDTAAHEATLDAGGNTLAVLGCGLDVVYPPENHELFLRIAQSFGSALVSEFPFGKKADRRTFPQRNRIIAGLAAGTLVVESDLAGGSIITANFAADCGRTVFALPGRVEQAGSRGCHKLIREGATLATCAEDILCDLTGETPLLDLGEPMPPPRGNASTEGNGAVATESEAKNSLSDLARRILKTLSKGNALSPDELAEQTGEPFPLVSANLLLLELDGAVSRKTDGRYEINA